MRAFASRASFCAAALLVAIGIGACGKTQSAPGLPAGVTVFPPPNGQGICPDPELRLTFSGPPALGASGLVQVFDADQPAAAPAAMIDMSAAMSSVAIGGMAFTLPLPAYVDGNDAIVHLRSGALTYGHTYYVTVDAGAILGPDGAPIAVRGATAWRFQTAAAGPANPAAITVSRDGTGDVCSVQGAFDAVPAGNTSPVTITVKAGTYREVVYSVAKSTITLHGEDRKLTIIAGTNNNNLNNSSKTRALVGIDNAVDIVVENLTIHNLTPQGGSQAEALRFANCNKCVVRDADILSLQDTLQWNGRLYGSNLYVEGNVDFVWGSGAAYFINSEFKTVGRPGFNVQARNAGGASGYVFVDSKLTSDPGLAGNLLARIDASMYPASQVVFINCELGAHIGAAGWQVTGAAAPDTLRFWEYQSHDPAGNPIDVSQRLAGSAQLTDDQAAMLRDPTMVLLGWQPPR
jgi:hypothetical protein